MTTTRFYRLANPAILSGVFRGWYHAKAHHGTWIEESVLMVHHLQDEEHFRVRRIAACYESSFLEEDYASMNFVGWSKTDSLAVFGTNYGTLFGGDLMHGKIHVDNFQFAKRNRRILGFRHYDLGAINDFTLCQTPEDINRMLLLMSKISADMETSLAA